MSLLVWILNISSDATVLLLVGVWLFGVLHSYLLLVRMLQVRLVHFLVRNVRSCQHKYHIIHAYVCTWQLIFLAECSAFDVGGAPLTKFHIPYKAREHSDLDVVTWGCGSNPMQVLQESERHIAEGPLHLQSEAQVLPIL